MLPEPPFRIAIIGGGPKGTYGFERLAAQFNASPIERPVEIHIFNRTPHFGSGEIYRHDQPDYLLINFSIGNIDMWLDEAPAAVVPEPLSLFQWLKRELWSSRSFDANAYAPRATVGQYLTAGFEAIRAHLPPNVSLSTIVGEVVDIYTRDEGYYLSLATADGQTRHLPDCYDSILLATGHPRPARTNTTHRLRQFASNLSHPGGYVPFVYPVERALGPIAAGSTVAIKGMGLTFVDTVLALSEGRGGRFERTGDKGSLTYIPSGNEPAKMIPFSRSGLPMLPRGPAFGPPKRRLKFFTPQRIQRIRTEIGGEALDFELHLLPLIEAEMIAAYYEILFRNHGAGLVTDSAQDEFEAIEALAVQVDDFHRRNPEEPRFTIASFLDPLEKSPGESPHSHHKAVLGYLCRGIFEARLGEEASPWMAAAAVWRYATPLFGEIFAFGGLTSDSQRHFEEHYCSPLSRVTFGPPIESMEKVEALARQGFIDFGHSRQGWVAPDPEAGGFRIGSDHTGAEKVAASLIDARIPKVSILNESAPLYQRMLERGMIQPFANRTLPVGDDYQPGCMALSSHGAVIDGQGRVNESIVATGTPTEGITFDNDTLSPARNNFVSGWARRIREQLEKEEKSGRLSPIDAHHCVVGT